jgi:hypothetical protein
LVVLPLGAVLLLGEVLVELLVFGGVVVVSMLFMASAVLASR